MTISRDARIPTANDEGRGPYSRASRPNAPPADHPLESEAEDPQVERVAQQVIPVGVLEVAEDEAPPVVIRYGRHHWPELPRAVSLMVLPHSFKITPEKSGDFGFC